VTVPQLLKQFPAFCVTGRMVTVFTDWSPCSQIGHRVHRLVTVFTDWSPCSQIVTAFTDRSPCSQIGHRVHRLVTVFIDWSPCSQIGHRVHRFVTVFTDSPPLVLILRQINPVHNLPSYLFQLHFNIILSFTPIPTSALFPSGFPTQILFTHTPHTHTHIYICSPPQVPHENVQ
jgi:hypothetical protein